MNSARLVPHFLALSLLASCTFQSPPTETTLPTPAMDTLAKRQMQAWARDRERDPVLDSMILTATLEESLSSSGARILNAGDAVLLSLPGPSLFTAPRRDHLSDDAIRALGHVAAAMAERPRLHAAVVGHVGGTSHAQADMILSERRAVSVKAAMMARGIDPCRISAVGRGADDHLAVPITRRRAMANDRMEILLAMPLHDGC